MISLKRHMSQHAEDTLSAVLDCYGGLVDAVAASAGRVCPAVGQQCSQGLRLLAERLCAAVSPSAVTETGREIQSQVDAWGTRAGEYYGRKTVEIRELLVIMAEAAAAASQRNQDHRRQFTAVSEQLNKAGDLEDLAQIRQLVRRTASEIKTGAERMAEENEQSVAALRTEVAAYQRRLEAAEAQAEKDELTGLLNRAGLTRALEARIRAGRPFCLLMADLNEFKRLNDRFGHLAGDEVLKTFGVELRAQFRALDVVARWGGDEFVVLIDAADSEIQTRMEAVRHWVFGDYTVTVDGKPRKTRVTAAMGLASWQPGMTAARLFAAADAAMYRDKARR
jgi:diguanylate cyclase